MNSSARKPRVRSAWSRVGHATACLVLLGTLGASALHVHSPALEADRTCALCQVVEDGSGVPILAKLPYEYEAIHDAPTRFEALALAGQGVGVYDGRAPPALA